MIAPGCGVGEKKESEHLLGRRGERKTMLSIVDAKNAAVIVRRENAAWAKAGLTVRGRRGVEARGNV